MKNVGIAIGLIIVGLVLIGVSLIWPRVITEKLVWNEQQAVENRDAALHLHEMTHLAAETRVSSSNDAQKASMEEQLAAAQRRYDSSSDGLRRARHFRHTGAIVLRWLGTIVVMVGVVCFMAGASRD